MAPASWLFVLLFVSWTKEAWSAAASTEYYTNITQLTFSGDHSFPRFSADRRYIYFSAKNGQYGKTCDDVYRLDLKYYNIHDDNWRISRVSTGLGHSTKVAIPTDNTGSIIYESSFESAFDDPNDALSTFSCPTPRCPTDTGVAPCSTYGTIEHFQNTNIYKTNNNGAPTDRFITPNAFNFSASPEQRKNWVVWTESCLKGPSNAQLQVTCMYISGKSSSGAEIKALDITPAETGYYDFVNFGTTDGTDTLIFFSFVKIDKTDNDPEIYSSANTIIKQGKISEVDGTIQNLVEFAKPPTKAFSRLYAKAYANNKAVITMLDPTGKQQGLYDVMAGGDPELRTDLKYMTKQADITSIADTSGPQQIVFARKLPGEKEYQIYLANFNGPTKNLIKEFNPVPAKDDDKKELDYLSVKKYVELAGQIGRARISELNSDLFFEWTGNADATCSQVYHIDTSPDDFTTFRRLSTGLASTAGMDYFVHSAADGRLSKSVIYSSDFMGQYSDVQTTDVSKCQLEGCAAGSEARKNNPELDTFCTAAKQTVYLGNNYELYQVNMFGNIEKRLTTNDFFDGEPSISLNNRLVYTQVGDSRTDLVVRWLDYPKSKSRIITSLLPVGYYGGASFSPDSKWIVFHGTQAGKDVYTFKKFLDTYQVVDTTVSEIFLVNVQNRTYRQVTNDGLCNQNPTFTPDGHILYEQTDTNGKHSLWQVSADGKNKIQLTKQADNLNALKFGFARNHPNATVFVSDKIDATTKKPANRIYFAEYKQKMPSTMLTSPASTTIMSPTNSITDINNKDQSTALSALTSETTTTTSAAFLNVTMRFRPFNGSTRRTNVSILPVFLIGYCLLRSGF
ncbi:Apical gut membrane polyprotein [Aphelenchoides bicaudatus]|nr:Apical gut membrane polyprotein [Aphelenchoides bicaudatus]